MSYLRLTKCILYAIIIFICKVIVSLFGPCCKVPVVVVNVINLVVLVLIWYTNFLNFSNLHCSPVNTSIHAHGIDQQYK